MFEEAFNSLYCEDNGRPFKPIRRMVGLLILKHVRNVSDESVVEQWQEKNVTFPTDAKLTRKIIGRVLKINGKLTGKKGLFEGRLIRTSSYSNSKEKK